MDDVLYSELNNRYNLNRSSILPWVLCSAISTPQCNWRLSNFTPLVNNVRLITGKSIQVVSSNRCGTIIHTYTRKTCIYRLLVSYVCMLYVCMYAYNLYAYIHTYIYTYIH